MSNLRLAPKTDTPSRLNTPFPEGDPLYLKGIPYSKLGKIATQVANTRIFQRLRDVNHAGFKPGAHSRFEHSVGTALIASHLWQSEEICHADQVHYILAALLHDIGHGAFSHIPEMATDICHKHFTRELILNHPELRKIWSEHNIDADWIVHLAEDKFKGNSITVPRTSGLISIDHTDNSVRNLVRRGKLENARELLSGIIGKLYINNNGIITTEDPEFARQFLRWSIHENTKVIFSPKDILTDKVTIILIQTLLEAGIITKEDLHHTDSHLIQKMQTSEAQEIIGTMYQMLTKYIPEMSEEEAEQYVTKIDQKPIPMPTSDPRKHAINGSYLFAPPVHGHPLNGSAAAAKKDVTEQIVGTYAITEWQEIADRLGLST